MSENVDKALNILSPYDSYGSKKSQLKQDLSRLVRGLELEAAESGFYQEVVTERNKEIADLRREIAIQAENEVGLHTTIAKLSYELEALRVLTPNTTPQKDAGNHEL